MRTVLLLIVLAAAAATGWKYRNDVPFLRDALGGVHMPAVPRLDAGSDDRNAGPAAAQDRATPLPAGGVRRCQTRDGRTLYTNDACPDGSREQAVKGGAVSVMPAYRPPPSATGASGAGGIPHARDLLAPKGGTLKDQAAERAMDGV